MKWTSRIGQNFEKVMGEIWESVYGEKVHKRKVVNVGCLMRRNVATSWGFGGLVNGGGA